MDYIKMVNSAIEYIESNLENDINLEKIAEEICFSPYHFHRIFKAMSGDSVIDYLRKRRMTQAAVKLINTQDRIIDIALTFKFDSQEAFTRAFKKTFKETPGRYRANGKRRALYERPRITIESLLHISKGGVSMEPKIITKKAFKVIGIRKQTCLKNNIIPQMWNEFFPRVGEIKNREGIDYYGICETNDIDTADLFNDETFFNELVCVAVKNFDHIPAGMVTKEIPEQKYAVFTHKGPLSTLRSTYDFIYKTYFPKSGHEIVRADDFELYDDRFTGPNEPNSEFDIYVPIK
ncbi:MAG: AraC family transcriptional regulator [Candidatus Wallbacteria bacterium]